MTWIYEKFLLQLDGCCHWPSQCHWWYAENKLVPAIPTVCDRKLQFGWLLTGGFPIPPGTWYLIPKEHMEFNIKGALLISTRWSNHGCFPSVLKCFADISCFTLQPFEKGWQTKVPRSYWAKQKYGKSQNLTHLKLLDRISCLVQISSFSPSCMNTWQMHLSNTELKANELDQKNAQGWSHLRGWLTWNHGYPRERL